MIPSAVVTELRSALVEYLASTFALADDDVRDALSEFLQDPSNGIFRGPYLKIRTPFLSVKSDWESPLDWLPDGFSPYLHQATAFGRLASTDGHVPEPTLVTTGTGSGKTECFLYPVLDHCARMQREGQRGIKAVILYPMNALASDQAGRIAGTIASEPALAGVRAGLYIGDDGSNTSMTETRLIDKRQALRDNPPDILLTNYKMLDFLLLREDDRELWAANRGDTLRYVVLDEFHTYDGAQGTDVAMLLRRLGARLSGPPVGGSTSDGATSDGSASEHSASEHSVTDGWNEAVPPLGGATPIATSATLGSGDEAAASLREFAGKVFGCEFTPESVIGEVRMTPEEACGETVHDVMFPAVDDLAGLGEFEDIAAAFGVRPLDPRSDDDPVIDLGKKLLQHPLTRILLRVLGDQSRSWSDAVTEVVDLVDEDTGWKTAHMVNPERVESALAQYLHLLSTAKRPGGRPLFSVEIQLWIREVSRLLRTVDVDRRPEFRWRDGAAIVDPDEAPRVAGEELPAVFCRRCGMSGWMATKSETSDALNVNPSSIYRAAVERSPQIRILMAAHADDPAGVLYSPSDRTVTPSGAEHTPSDAVPVLMTASEDDAKKNRCPGCGEANTVRFVGLAVASLASVSINTLFGSPHVELEERKLLAFTDSVQDASHRAAFFGGRTHRINLRTLMAREIQEGAPSLGSLVGADRDAVLTLADLGERLFDGATGPREVFGLIPPDLVRDPTLRSFWQARDGEPVRPTEEAERLLRSRLGFEAAIEFGLRSRVGRTLELSRVAAAQVHLDQAGEMSGLIAEETERSTGQRPDPDVVSTYLRGLLERLRLSGGIHHELLDPYVASGGRHWFVWGGRPPGLPPFTPDIGRPSFFTTASRGDFDSLTALGTTHTWLVDWALRTIGGGCALLDPAKARDLNVWTLTLLSKETETVVGVRTDQGATVFGLDPASVLLHEVAGPTEAADDSVLRCELCGHVHAAPSHLLDQWVGSPCLRYRCPGTFAVAEAREGAYYRRLYRSGVTRRVVTGEHTGLLKRANREELEAAFTTGTAPDAPNVLTATPTLEMGIDIGDLSAVMLTSVPRNPAAYIQRVGRAGRKTGNSLVTTFVTSDRHGLYYLSDPEAMIAGDVRPPNCFLDASDTIQRQYLAYLIDRVADFTIDAETKLPREMGKLAAKGLEPDGVIGAAVLASETDPSHVERFVALFGDHLTDTTVAELTAYASAPSTTADDGQRRLRSEVERGFATWDQHQRDLGRRRDRLVKAIDRLETQAGGPNALTAEDNRDLASLYGQRTAISNLIGRNRSEYALSALERIGLLPNFNLIDDSVTISATLWWTDDDGRYETDLLEYQRPGRRAITELAPGNHFYAGGHRHLVDSLEIGAADAPLYETWRLCPECGFSDLDAEGEPPTACPRCASPAIADSGAAHQMLRLANVAASGSEEGARVFDESDDRRREQYDTVLAVDVPPEHVEQAWQLADKPFGAELASVCHLRTINLGLAERSGDKVPIAGEDRHVSRFTVCVHCGAVSEPRDDRDGTQPERLHEGWCKVRNGSVKPQFDRIVLFHELTTEAVRMVLPVSMFEVGERLTAFKGALLLGLREDFGGDPDHLEVGLTDAPNREGHGRRRFLVLFDNVPGGTGYLARLANPDRVREILEKGREAIARCPCVNDGVQACHRCLLGVVERTEYDLARRDVALDVLEELLAPDAWQPRPIDTVARVKIGTVEESELERRFRVALADWADNAGEDVRFGPIPGKGRFKAWELAIRSGGEWARYRIDEQEGLTTSPSTVPDYVIRRQDDRAPDIAVYLDGYQFHASADINHIARDAAQRNGIRRAGKLVWNLTWDDVRAFHDAISADPTRQPPQIGLLSSNARRTAKLTQQQRASDYFIEAIEQNPMALLLDYLYRPDREQWRNLALSAVGGLAAGSAVKRPIAASAVRAELKAALAARPARPAASAGEAPHAMMFGAESIHGLPVRLLLDARDGRTNEERWTVVAALDDSMAGAEDDHRARWQDWLHWANVLQFLSPAIVANPGREVIIAATSAADDVDLDGLQLVAMAQIADGDEGSVPEAVASVPAGRTSGGSDIADASRLITGDGAADGAGPAVPLSDDMVEELSFVDDEAVRAMVSAVLGAGAPDFVAGEEVSAGAIDKYPVEATWPQLKVGVQVDVDPITGDPNTGFDDDGWVVRPVGAWTPDELHQVLAARGVGE